MSNNVMYVFIDETCLNDNDYAYCAVAIEEKYVENYKQLINEKRNEILNNPLVLEVIKVEELKKSFHYTQDHRRIKNTFFDLLATLFFEATIYIYHDVKNHESTRISFINALNDFFCRKYKQKTIIYEWEKDDGMKIKWPSSIKISEVKKEGDDLLSIADYVLGSFRATYLAYYIDRDDQKLKSCKGDYLYIENKIRFVKICRK